MSKFFCFGLKDFCDCDIICADCTYFDNSGGEYRDAPKTNADHIRSMTDEELAEMLCVSCDFCACNPLDNCPSTCQVGVLNWLKQPFKEET